MALFHSILKLLENKKISDTSTETRHQYLFLNFILIIAAITDLFFSVVHILFFEHTIAYVLFGFFIAFLLILFLFNLSLNYKTYSLITILILTSLFSLITLTGAGDKIWLIWGLTFPVMLAFMTKYKNYNIFSILFLFITFAVFFIPNQFDFWAKYSSDIIIHYLFAYFLIYALIEFYLRLKQEAVNKNEKELIETKHKLLEKNKFLSSLSYEIRTPLNNIAGIINHQRESINENVIEEIELSISNLASTLNNIPKNTDQNILHLTSKKTAFNINNIIKKSIRLFQTDAYSKLRFNLYLSEKLPENVFGDRISFLQLFISSIDFFFNHSNKNPLKIIIVSQETDTKTILIKISSKSENLLFKRNLNKKNLIKDIKGLNILNQITESLNGKLTIQKTEDNFTILYQLSFEELPNKNINKINNSSSVNFTKSFSHKKILLKNANVLLVEDDVINSKVMTLNIQKFVNKIIVAENGKKALEKFSETKVDIILMDIRMPYMDGFKTTEKIREAEIGSDSHVPIIAVTANTSSEIKKHCFEVGMSDYTTKPTNYKLLLKKMENLLEN